MLKYPNLCASSYKALTNSFLQKKKKKEKKHTHTRARTNLSLLNREKIKLGLPKVFSPFVNFFLVSYIFFEKGNGEALSCSNCSDLRSYIISSPRCCIMRTSCRKSVTLEAVCKGQNVLKRMTYLHIILTISEKSR